MEIFEIETPSRRGWFQYASGKWHRKIGWPQTRPRQNP